MKNKQPKVAIVCDWLTGTGGAERVVLELHKMFPNATIYTSQYNPNPKIWYGGEWFKNADIKTGWLQKLPKSLKKFLPVFRALYFSRLDLDGYNLVISSSGAEAKFIKVKPGATHITYCHAPTHYFWARYDEYLTNPGFGKLDFLARIGLKLLVGPMRMWDHKAAQRPDYFIANSSFTQDQIKKYYGREAQVIHPPVDVERFQQATGLRHGFVAAGRQTPYKRVDFAVAACTKLDLPLIVIGSGPEHKKLKSLAGKSVTFLRDKSDEEVAHYLQSSLAFIFPGIDDFGIVAVEAMAAGTPVIAYKGGGALDYVVQGKTGLFFELQTAESLANALQEFNKHSFNHPAIARSAAKFSAANFEKNLSKLIEQVLKTAS